MQWDLNKGAKPALLPFLLKAAFKRRPVDMACRAPGLSGVGGAEACKVAHPLGCCRESAGRAGAHPAIQPALGLSQYTWPLLLWFGFCLPVQARITSCDDRAIIDSMIEVPGVPLSSASRAGDVLLRRVFTFSIGYRVDSRINNDRMRLGAGWADVPNPLKFDTHRLVPGLGVRWRHLDSVGNYTGRIIGGGHGSTPGSNTWSLFDDTPQAAGSYSKRGGFVQELVLTDPTLYKGGEGAVIASPFSIYAHGTGSGASQNVPNGCNSNAGGAEGNGNDWKSPKPVYPFIYTNWSGGTAPPLPSPTCKVSLASQKLGVSMNSIDVSKLDRKDAVSQDSVPFSIRLEECAINAKPSINFTDAGTPANNGNTLMPNNANAGRSAQGLGVRLRRNVQTDVYFGPPSSSDSRRRILVGTASSDNPVLMLDLNAHYVRTTDESIKPGAFAATTTFVLSYP
ncbi:fimbrial protein [Chromobacterium haemolyticum]|uniref:fimbrial protein n=1 Tax=Chromobacterium haemolyticum TaxID=394935 RepID=UPI0009DB6D81|nr:fimbrial protein [Chromobacterium haemolyticum]PTU71529.1 type 1 fimbrial protein [Chromobacterium haemolyticum]